MDEDDVLILSPFTGAARELPDSLIVSPYDTESLADAIFTALNMSSAERTNRMIRMRAVVKERNLYRWAGTLIGELCDLRLPHTNFKRSEIRSRGLSAPIEEIIREYPLHDLGHARAMRAGGHNVGG